MPRGADGMGTWVTTYTSVRPAKDVVRRPFRSVRAREVNARVVVFPRRQVETSQQLKLDLAILAEAFSAKEAELEAVSAKLEGAAGREADLKQQLKAAETSMAELKVGKQPC